MRVSVLIRTYNVSKYIAQALDSVLMQTGDVDYEIVIGDDCSTDNTRDIISAFQQKHPATIRLLVSPENLGVQRNLQRTLDACRGEYVALLDGDDYWTSLEKLKRQMRFLDAHPECAICFHNVLLVDEEGKREIGIAVRPEQNEISAIEDLLKRNFIPTSSVMFRRGLFNGFPDWWYEIIFEDWSLHIFNSQYGKIGYLSDVMSAYRKHSAGVYSGLGYVREMQTWIIVHEFINAYFSYKYHGIIKPIVLHRWDKLATLLVERGVQLASDQINMMHVLQVFDNWPAELPLDDRWKNQVLGRIFERLFFQSYHEGNLEKVRYCWIQLIRCAPTRLKNRGVWSIGMEAVLGRRLAAKLRSLVGNR